MSENVSQTFQRACKIDFKDVNFTVQVKNKKKGEAKQLQVLKGCTGTALPGQTTFIMGASGAGKTSLLNVISDRIRADSNRKITGSVTVNNAPLSQNNFGSIGAYVMQDDILF